jgi:hypothetical protein
MAVETTPTEKTLNRVATFLADPARSIERTLRIMLSTNHLGTDAAPVVHPVWWPRSRASSSTRARTNAPSRRKRSARRAEHRRHPGRSRWRPRPARPLGEDRARPADRRHPARAARRERIETGGAGIGGIEQQAGGEAAAPASGELPVLALDVVDHGGAGPGQHRRHHQADALAGAGRRHGEDVLGAVMAQIGVIEQSEHDAARR